MWLTSSEVSIESDGATYRLLEYSVSASLMTITIAVEVGITDVYTLMCMFLLISSCMWFGLYAQTTEGNKWWPHAAGWITFVVAYAPIFDTYFTSTNNSIVKSPDFVTAIVFAEFGIFALFGIVQLLSLLYQERDSQLKQEQRFITLSIVAKSLLAWVVLGPAIQASKS